MFDYKKFLEELPDNIKLEVIHSHDAKEVEINANREGLLYLASRMLDFALIDCAEGQYHEFHLDPGIDLSEESDSICVDFICED